MVPLLISGLIPVLDRKLMRDLWHFRGQVLAIGLVIAAGVAITVMSLGTLHSLKVSRDAFYTEYRFPDVFAQAKRAPEQVARRVADLPGVARVQTRIVEPVILDMPGLMEPVRAQILSLPEAGEPALNDVLVRRGRGLRAQHPDEVLVNELFAAAHGLEPGDTIIGNINGKRRTLTVAGMALAPEVVYSIGPGDLVPDNRRFATLWMSRPALEAAFDLKGAFNDLAVSLTRAGSEDEIVDRIDTLLAPYGSTGAYTRQDHLSDSFLRSEFDQLTTTTQIVPPIFMAVAVFLLNIVIARMVDTEREQIGLMKAFGYSNGSVAWHYLKFVLAVAAVGIVLGWAMGAWLGLQMAELYANYYRFPELVFVISPGVFVGTGAAFVLAAIGGGAVAVRRAAVLPPAVAMRAPPPTNYRNRFLNALAPGAAVSPLARMVLRHVIRWPVRSFLTVLGLGFAVTMLISSLFFINSIDTMLDAFFYNNQRQDITLTFAEAREDALAEDVAHLPGLMRTELVRHVPVRITHGHRSRRLGITGIDPGADLNRLVDAEGDPVTLPPEGLVMTRALADILKVRAGDPVIVEVLEGRRPERQIAIAGLVEEFIGLSAYMDRTALNRLLLEPPSANTALALIDEQQTEAFYDAVKQTPFVQGVADRQAALREFRRLVEENMLTMISFYVFFAALIAIGVVYNSARILLAERGRELASLRVLGFRKSEVAFVLLGEISLLTFMALPLGCLMGYGMAALMIGMFSSDLYRLPLAIAPATYGYSVSVVIAASALTGLAVARRVANLDLIAVLKTRE